jgi:hypothetical protein
MDQQEPDLEENDDGARQRILEALRFVARAVICHLASGGQSPITQDQSSFRHGKKGTAKCSETLGGDPDRSRCQS